MAKMVDFNFYNGKTVFITGHTGFKGSWLSRILILAGAKVVGYSLAPMIEPNLYDIIELDKSMISIIGDINNLTLLKESIAFAQPQVVFHLAAQPIVRESYNDPVGTYMTNVMGTVNLFEACRNIESIRSIVNVTTDKVYENKEWEWGYREDENLCGFDPYSNSKSCSELVTYSYINSFYKYENAPSISTARSGNVIGGGDFSLDRIIPDCVRAAMINKNLEIRNPNSTRPYQHVLECLSGYLLLAERQYDNTDNMGNYNFGPDDSSCVTTGQLADMFCECWGDFSWICNGQSGPHEANFLKLDCSKAKKHLGWYPDWTIKDAINKTVEWYRCFSKRADMINITDKQIKEYFRI